MDPGQRTGAPTRLGAARHHNSNRAATRSPFAFAKLKCQNVSTCLSAGCRWRSSAWRLDQSDVLFLFFCLPAVVCCHLVRQHMSV